MGVCNCSMFCCTLLYIYSSIAIILMGNRELIALLNLSSWCLVMVERLFLAVQRGCLQFVIVVFPDHTHLLFLNTKLLKQGYLYQKLCKGFYKFYHRPSELIVKYNVGLKTLLQQGILEPVLCGDLAYKFTKILGKSSFYDQF